VNGSLEFRRAWSVLVRLPKTACWKHRADLESASKAAAEVVKLEFLLTPVELFRRPEIFNGAADPYFPES